MRRMIRLFVLLLISCCCCCCMTNAFQLPTSSSVVSNKKSSFPRHPIAQSPPKRSSSSSSTQLSASPFLSQLGSISVLAVVIIVHEAGHYLAAKTLFQMKVDEFSIGLGPKLLGFNKWGNDFSLRAIPLGGYVKFPEHYNTTLEFQRDEERFLYDAQQESKEERQWNNVLSLGTYEARIEAAEQRQTKKQKKEEKVTGPFWKRLFAKKTSNPKSSPLLPPSDEIEYYDDPDLLQNRPWPQRAVVIAGGVVFNFALAFLLYFAQISSPAGLTKPVLAEGARVSQMPPPSAQSFGKLQTNDVILGVNGKPLMSSSMNQKQQPSLSTSSQAIQEFIQIIRATPDGGSLQLQVLKAESKKPVDITIQPKGQVPSIGAMLAPNVIGLTKIHGSNVLESTQLASQCVGEITSETFRGLTQAVGKTLQPKGPGGGGGPQLSGPIGLLKTGSDVVSTAQWAAVLTFAAAISVNLAVVNSLPLPALDGGQMVFVLAEAVTGKKVDTKVQETITFVTILLLLGLTVSTTVGDVQNIVLKK
mmetsp:Transcript_3259/g.4852  ORF Transcript_3259/g.4852 Transcript_3259/m.4852 type:complete len:530 (-) Transcript_3259:147-1736(-)